MTPLPLVFILSVFALFAKSFTLHILCFSKNLLRNYRKSNFHINNLQISTFIFSFIFQFLFMIHSYCNLSIVSILRGTFCNRQIKRLSITCTKSTIKTSEWRQLLHFGFLYSNFEEINQVITPWVHDVNCAYMRRSEDIQRIFSTLYVRSINILWPGGMLNWLLLDKYLLKVNK